MLVSTEATDGGSTGVEGTRLWKVVEVFSVVGGCESSGCVNVAVGSNVVADGLLE